MKLNRLTERIWIYPFEEERDRPNLGYVRGDRRSLAVDAGHSDAHVREFYGALEEAGLPLPDLTVLTHWHWDHTFGMHAVHGLTLANARTDRYLRQFRERVRSEGDGVFLALHESIRREYAGNRPVVVIPADIAFSGEISLDLGGCSVRLFQSAAPHTDDSTFVEIPGEKVLFLGDSTGGVFPTWARDAALAAKLAGMIAATDMDAYIPGHGDPMTKEAIIADLMEED